MSYVRHLLLATLEDTSDPHAWSGIPYSLRRALESRLDRVSVIDRLPVKRTIHHGALRLALAGSPPRWPLWATDPALKQFAAYLQRAVDTNRPDAILSISSQTLVHYEPSVPTGLFCDAPWLAWKKAYQQYEPMPLNGPRFARKEAIAAAKCAAIIFSSQWAVDEGKRMYGIGDGRFHVAPLGATWVPEISPEQLERRVLARDKNTLKLLFLGRDWERKGGPLALEIVRFLVASGVPATLDIVGCNPKVQSADYAFVNVHGPLYRDFQEQAKTMRRLFFDSHFLAVPTDAECFGIVFAEASAHALPVISKRVCAVPSIVNDGETGILEQPGADVACYASRILDVFRNRSRYVSMAMAARKRYEQNFTWDICAQRVILALEDSLRSRGGVP